MRSFKSLFALVGLLFCLFQAKAQSYQQVVQTSGSGDKVFLEINLRNLQESMDTIFSNLSGLSSSSSSDSWGDVLQNGSNPGMDINFNSYDIQGLGNLTATGTLNADSLTLNKDADITGSLSVTDVVDFGDSLSVAGYVLFSDSLQVVKAVTIGETLFVTGVTSLGDSLHVSGNVDLDALFNVDGAATFGSTMVVAGETTLNDSLHVNSGANITGTLEVDGETTLNDSLHVNASVDVAGDLSVGGEFQAASLRADSSIAQGGSASNYNTVALGASSVASGVGAVAAGYGTSAAGIQSAAIGTNASASGINAVAIGEGAQASAGQAVAVGKNAKVSSDYASTAVGMNSEVTVGWGHTALGGGKVNPPTANSSQNMAFGASTISTEGSYNISMGYNSTISGNSSTTGSMTFGPSSTVSGGYRNMTFGAGASISGSNSNYAMGDYSSVSGGAWHAYALGNNSKVQANGHHAFAFGHYSEVSAYNAANFAFKTPARFSHQAIFGAYADTTQMVPVSGSHNDWIGSDPLFVVANGATESTRSNALMIRKDGAAMFSDSLHVAGHVTLGDQLTVTGVTTLNDSLHVNSSADISGTLEVTGLTTLNDSLHVNSSADITGTLEVDGETTLNDRLHVNSGVNITGDLVLGTTNVNNALADIIPFNHYEAWIQHSSIISGITASTTAAQMFVDSTSTQSVDPESIYGLSGGDVTIQSSGYYEIQGYVFGSRTTAGSGYITASVSVGPGNPLPQCTATKEWTLNVNSSARTNCRIQVLEGQTIRLNVVEQAGGTSNITDAGIVLKKVANTLSPG